MIGDQDPGWALMWEQEEQEELRPESSRPQALKLGLEGDHGEDRSPPICP